MHQGDSGLGGLADNSSALLTQFVKSFGHGALALAAEKLAAMRLLDVTSCLCAWTELRAQGEGPGEAEALLVGIMIVRDGKILED